MKIQFQCKQRAAGHISPAGASRREAGDSFTKMLTGIAVLSVSVTALCKALAPAYDVIQSTRENLRASQIVMQKAEALRLLTPSQVCDTNDHRKPLFVEGRDFLGGSNNLGAVQYTGYVSAPLPGASDPAKAARGHLRPVTVTVCWTNSEGAKPIVQRRQIQAMLARNGTPKYIWGAL